MAIFSLIFDFYCAPCNSSRPCIPPPIAPIMLPRWLNMPKLNKRTIDSLKPKETTYEVWDSELKGYMVRVLPSGTKSYAVFYRKGKKQRKHSFGRVGVLTPDEARDQAKTLLGDIAKGHDPSGDKQAYRNTPTMDELGQRFLSDYVPDHCKPRTAGEYRRAVEKFINPNMGKLKVTDIDRADISALHGKLKDKPYQANRVLGVLSKMFNLAEEWGLRPDGTNPTRLVKKYPEKKNMRFLSEEELQRLGKTLDELEAAGTESLPAINAIRLLVLTGCRLSEIQTLKWDYISGDRITLPDTKTGERTIPLTDQAKAVLEAIERKGDNPYVITGKGDRAHLTDMQKPWRRIREAAGLIDVRIHDLRHTFASRAVSAKMPIQMVGKLLGHKTIQTTMRYAHLDDDAQQQAANQISDMLGGMLKG